MSLLEMEAFTSYIPLLVEPNVVGHLTFNNPDRFLDYRDQVVQEL